MPPWASPLEFPRKSKPGAAHDANGQLDLGRRGGFTTSRFTVNGFIHCNSSFFGFAFLCKSKTSFLADLTWIISKLLFLWVLWVWNQSEKINCAPSPRVLLYQLGWELPELHFGCSNLQDGKIGSCPEISLSLLLVQGTNRKNSSHDTKKNPTKCFKISTVRKNSNQKKVHTPVGRCFQLQYKYFLFLKFQKLSEKSSSFLDHLYLNLLSPLKTSFHRINVAGLCFASLCLVPSPPIFFVHGRSSTKFPCC